MPFQHSQVLCAQQVWPVGGHVLKAWRAKGAAEMHDYLFISNTVAAWAWLSGGSALSHGRQEEMLVVEAQEAAARSGMAEEPLWEGESSGRGGPQPRAC